LDKTGTLTLGSPQVVEVKTFNGKSEAQIITLAALAEKFSEHPLAKAVLEKANKQGICTPDPSSFEALPGQGVIVSFQSKEIMVGNEKLLENKKVIIDKEAQNSLSEQKKLGHTVFLVCENRSVVGLVSVADVSRQGVAETITNMRRVGVKHVIMLTGDNSATALAIADRAGISEVGAELLPKGKVDYVKKLKNNGNRILMVGDGINDAPALATADIGMAIGTGTDVAIEAADITLISGDLRLIPTAIRLSRRTMNKIKQNLFWAFFYNAIGIPFAALGMLNPVIAGAAMAFSSVSVVANSLSLKRFRVKNTK
jgi:Cu+-exporting ATPase